MFLAADLNHLPMSLTPLSDPFRLAAPFRVPSLSYGLLAALALALLTVVGASPAEAQDYYSDIRPVLVENCMGCHTEEGPSWSMEDPEVTYEERRRIGRAVDRRIMPPWLAAPGHQDYVGDRSLDDATLALIERWVDAGYPKGDPRPDPDVDMSVRMAAHGAFSADVTLAVNGDPGYLPEQSQSDDYHCFLVDWTGDETTYVTGFRTVPGNTNVAHHLVVYSVRPEMWSRYQEIDDEYGPGEGYRCFGGALPDQLGRRENRAAYEARYPDGVRELARANDWLAHWAPGMDGHVFPEGTGIKVEPGSGLVVQMHYYASEAPGEVDSGTRMEFMTAREVERPAVMFAQTRNDWLSGEDNNTMVIPAGEQRTYGLRENLGEMMGYFAYLTGIPEERVQALEVHSANLHMHAFGHSGDVTLTRATGEMETLLQIPRWDLAWQRDFTFEEPKLLAREELADTWLGVQCTYDNPTDQIVYGGLGSFDEMCFNFSYIAVQQGEPVSTTEGAGGR